MKERTRVSGSIAIGAGPEVIFGLVTDLPRMGEWSPENRGGQWQDGATEAAVGARFLGTNANGRKKWDVAVIVTELTPPSRFEFRTVWMGTTIARWIYEIERTPTGCTVTETWVDLRPPTLAWLLAKQITNVHDRAAYNRRSIETTLVNLKRTAESIAYRHG